MLSIGRVNRFASLAILPLMALALAFAWRLQQAAEDEAAALPREGLLVVANLRAESLTFVELAHELPRVRSLSVPGPAHELAALDDRLYVTLARGDRLLKVNPAAPGVVRELHYPGGTPHGLAVSRERILVTLDGLDRVEELHPLTLETVRSWPTGDTPHAIAAAGHEIYVTDTRDDQLRRLDHPPVIAPASALPESVAINGDLVVTADADGRMLSLFQRVSLEPVGQVPLAGRPVRVIPFGSDRVLVALNDTAEVAVVDLSNLVVERRLAVGARPDGICLSPSGEYLAVVSNGEDSVRFFRLADWLPAGALTTPRGPGACLWLPISES